MPQTVTIVKGDLGIDFASDTPALRVWVEAQAKTAQPIRFGCVYMPPFGQTVQSSWKAAKPATMQWMQDVGMGRVLIYEGTATDVEGGRTKGERNGAWAAKIAAEEYGYPTGQHLGIIACADENVGASILAAGIDYMTGFAATCEPYDRWEYAPERLGAATLPAVLTIPGASSWSKRVFQAMRANLPFFTPVTMIQRAGPGAGVDLDRLKVYAPFPAMLTTPDPPPAGPPVPPHWSGPTADQRTWLERGSTGPNVVELQKRLHAHGLYRGYPEDGKFGRQTQNAVEAFQKAHRLFVDGKVGPKTWAALA